MLTFRPATVDDLPAVVDLVNAAFRAEGDAAGWTTESHVLGGPRATVEMLQLDVESPAGRIVLAEQSGALVGCAHVERVRDERGYLGMFAVRPALQGAGLGSLLLAEAERIVRDEWHLPLLRMTVLNVRQELLDYYGRRGYRATGERAPFPPPGVEHLVVVRKQGLELVVLTKSLT